MLTKLTEEQKLNLKKEFINLKSITEKLKFWEESLQKNYIDFIIESSNLITIRKLTELEIFKIDFYQQDWQKMNEWIIQNFNYNTCKIPVDFKLLNLINLKKELNKKLRTTKDRRIEISEEIKKVKRFSTPTVLNPVFKANEKFNFIFNANFESYDEYFQFKILPDYSKSMPDITVIEKENGKILGQYHLYLLTELNKSFAVIKDDEGLQLTTKQIAMVLYYTGVLKDVKTNDTIKAKIFSSLINISHKNFYDCIREVEWSGDKTEEDYDAVIKFLIEKGLEEFATRVRKDFKFPS